MAENEEKLSWAERLWEAVQTFFATQSTLIWTNFLPFGREISKNFFNDAAEKMSDIESTQWENMLATYQSAGILTKEDAENIMQLKDQAHPYDWLFYIITLGRLFGTYVTSITAPGSSFLDQGINMKYGPGLPQPTDILKAAFIAPEKTGEVRDIFRKMGLKSEHIDLMFLNNYALYSEEIVRVLYLRGILSTDQMFMRMRELGYTDTRIKEIVEAWPLIPGPADLLHMVAKEAFEPEAIELMGLGDEFPEEQVHWLEKQGLSREWAQKFWYAHWDQPSIGQGFEMLHRGVIGATELDMLFRTVEIPPYWREKLTKIAYLPYTRVDTRRMHDMGVLTDAELIRAYMDQGYDEERAGKMAEFTILYNRRTDKELTRSQVLSGYREGIISKEDTKTMLMDLEYSDAQADYYILFEDYMKEKEYQDDLIDNIRDRYQTRLIDHSEARKLLDDLNLPATQRDILLDKWDIKVFKGIKLPSKTDLDKFLRNDIINLDTYRIEMDKLGYDFQYTQWYEELTMLKKAK